MQSNTHYHQTQLYSHILIIYIAPNLLSIQLMYISHLLFPFLSFMTHLYKYPIFTKYKAKYVRLIGQYYSFVKNKALKNNSLILYKLIQYKNNLFNEIYQYQYIFIKYYIILYYILFLIFLMRHIILYS